MKTGRWFVGLFAVLTLVFGACPADEPDSGKGPPTVFTGALRAVPVAPSKMIVDSFTVQDKNWYIIDAGFIRNSLVMQMGPVEYQGFGTVTLSKSESVEISVSESRTETVTNSVVVSNGQSTTESLETGIKATVTGGVGLGPLKVGGSLETSLAAKVETTVSVNTTTGRSKETSESFISTLTKKTASDTSFTVDRNEANGFYRMAWYTTNDVYFIISTNQDNTEVFSWDVVSCPREGELSSPRFEYSPDGVFDNSPAGNLTVFETDFWKNLGTPEREILIVPSGVVATAQSSGNILVSWDGVSGAASYVIYRSASANGNYTRIGTSTSPTYTNSGLSAGTVYYYKVSQVSASGAESGLSSYAYTQTKAATLAFKEYSIGGTFESGGLETSWKGWNRINTISDLYKNDFNVSSLKAEGYTKVTLKYSYTIRVWGDIEYELRLRNITTSRDFTSRPAEKLSGNNKSFSEVIEHTVNLSEIETGNTFHTLEIQSNYRKQNWLWGGHFSILNRVLTVRFSK